MDIPDSDKYPVHTVVAPSEVMSARTPGMANRHDTTGSTRVEPALGAESEMPAPTAESSQMESYQEAYWKGALHAGDTRESETNKYTLDQNISVLLPARYISRENTHRNQILFIWS